MEQQPSSLFKSFQPGDVVEVKDVNSWKTLTMKRNGATHADGESASRTYFGGRLWSECFFKHGAEHRDGGPAYIGYNYMTGQPSMHVFFNEGLKTGGQVLGGDAPIYLDTSLFRNGE